MLEFMREHASSWIVKALFGIIVLVFVFWGIGGMQQNGDEPVVATVEDKQILNREFLQTYEQEVEHLRSTNPELSTEDLEQMDFKRQVLQRMINNYLLRQKAEEWGLEVTQEEMRHYISNMEIFQGPDQRFDPDRYRTILQSSRMSPEIFEAELRGDLLSEKLQEALLGHFQPPEHLARDFFQFLSAEATMQYLHLPWEDFLQEIDLSEEEIKAYYEQNQDNFEQPPKMRMDYLLLTPEALADSQEISEEELQAYYEQNLDLFEVPEKIQARHILLELEPSADEEKEQQVRQQMASLQDRLDQDAEFADLARAYSDCPSALEGGDLGWMQKGDLVEEFEEAAFELQPGETSGPVRTGFGLHLIHVQDRQEVGFQELEEVQEEVAQRLAQDKAAEEVEEFLDEALILIMDTGNIQEAAQQLNLQAESSDFFSRQEGPAELNLDPEQVDQLFALEEQESTSRPIMLDQGYLLAQKIEEKPSQVRPLDEVRGDIEKTLRHQKARNKAKQEAQDILAGIEQGQDKSRLDELQISEPFTREGQISGLGTNRDLARDIFRIQPGEWLSRPYEFRSGYVLAQLKDISKPDQEEWKASRTHLVSSLAQSKRQMFFQAFLDDLRDRADIDIKSPEALRY